MKIKTITCHDVYNVGASLQAFALTEYLKQQGYDTEIINYKPYYLRHYELFGVRNPRFNKPILREIYQMLKFPGRLKKRFDPRKNTFDLFTKNYLPLTEQKYESNGELKNDPPQADVYIAGSDQIWNPLFQNGRDAAFFLDFVPKGKKKLSYAASFAVDCLSDNEQLRMKKWLSDFDGISIREKSGIALVEQMKLFARQVCDPVFLLKKEQWESFIKENEKAPYIFLYDFDGNPKLLEIAKRLATENHLRIVSAFSTEGADEFASDMGPIEFINLIFYADLIISNSFHATAFSLIFEKCFYVFNRRENINTRMRDLLLDLGLEDRLITEFPNYTNEIDWIKTKTGLSAIKTVSEEYLREHLI